jgi:hypothetical protein
MMNDERWHCKNLAELHAYHRENECINIKKLKVRTRVLLRTDTVTYELEVGTPERAVVLVASDGDVWNSRRKMSLLGSIDTDTGVLLDDIICQDLKLSLQPRRGRVVRIGPIRSARIMGEGYAYELWNDES